METRKFRIEIDPQSLVPSDQVRRYYVISLGLALLMAVGIVLVYKSLPQVVPMFFTEPWGEARLSHKALLYLLPSTAVVVTVVNVLIGRLIEKEHRALVHSLGVGTMLVAIMLLLGLYGIIQSLL